MKDYFTPWRKWLRYSILLGPRILREGVFRCSRLIPSDRLYLKIVYFLTFGKWLDLDHPESLRNFNEKLQWLKLHNDTPLHTRMADKVAVRRIIEEKIGPGYTFPLLGVWEHFDDIDFSRLPEQFVLKPSHDSGSIVFCRDKQSFDRRRARKKLEAALRRNYFWFGREMPYKDIPPRILAEPLMVDESGTQLKDFKLFCFDGEVKVIQVDFNRFTGHRRNLYTPQWERLDMFIMYPNAPQVSIPRPKKLDEMLKWGAELSRGFPFLRVDFYEIHDRIYFGEFTFHHEGGLGRIKPERFNTLMGDWIRLPQNRGEDHADLQQTKERN